MMKLRVVSDGTPHSTRILDEAGNELEGVTKLSVEIDVERGMNEVHVTFWGLEIDVKGELGNVVREKLKPPPPDPPPEHETSAPEGGGV